MRKPTFTVPLLALAALVVFPMAASAQEDANAFHFSNFSLELLGGYTGLNPEDFNDAASYEEAYLQFNYVAKFNYYQALYGNGYQVTSRRIGDAGFNPLKGSPAYGFRLRYNISPSLGLSIGVQSLSGTQNSNVEMNVDVTNSASGNGESLSYQYQNPGFRLAVSAWSPQLAAHFGWDIGRILRLEILVAGGPLFIQCRTRSERRMISTDQAGFRTDSLYVIEMNGETKGLAGELGGRAGLRLTGFLNFFAEGGFAFRAADEVRGTGWSQTTISDSNGAQDPVTAEWSGEWSIQMHNSLANWGRFKANQPQNRIPPGPGFSSYKFMIDLSGFQIKAGLSFKI